MESRLITPSSSIQDILQQLRQIHQLNKLYQKNIISKKQESDNSYELLQQQFKILEKQIQDSVNEYKNDNSLETRTQMKKIKEVLQKESKQFEETKKQKQQKQFQTEQETLTPNTPIQKSPEYISLQLQTPLELDSHIINQRTNDLKDMGNIVCQIKEIMNDQYQMVDQQGQTLQLITSNVNKTDMNVQKAQHEMEKAYRFSIKSRKRVFCCMTLIFTFVLIILVAYHHSIMF